MVWCKGMSDQDHDSDDGRSSPLARFNGPIQGEKCLEGVTKQVAVADVKGSSEKMKTME